MMGRWNEPPKCWRRFTNRPTRRSEKQPEEGRVGPLFLIEMDGKDWGGREVVGPERHYCETEVGPRVK